MIKVTKTIATIAFLFLGCLVNAQVGTLSVSRTEEKGVSFPLFAFGDEVFGFQREIGLGDRFLYFFDFWGELVLGKLVQRRQGSIEPVVETVRDYVHGLVEVVHGVDVVIFTRLGRVQI